ncbi:MAG: exopolysaccharide biosynthesis polyprenyl glycosylphosphotransferase [Dysgonamonadaceae bacterium]|jgi:exopolysaccharide biosynthesis polyprenyl glycosylphosphotransferase|nr:exopolysaccharide biosynthesis polyprenyl glycosylphosphotransferase [Dysgonamonadaceae bacterium]
MKRSLYVILDLLIVYGSILLAYFLLFQLEMLDDFDKNFKAFQIITPFIGIFYLVLMYIFGLHNIARKTVNELIYTVFLISVLMAVGIMGISFFVRETALAFPRSVILLSTLFYFLLLSFWRLLVVFITGKIHGIKTITIIGDRDSKIFEALMNKYQNHYRIENRCADFDISTDFDAIIESVDEIFLSTDIPQKIRRKILALSIKYKKGVFFVPEYYDLSIMASTFDKTSDLPTYRVNHLELSPEDEFVKRVVDIVLACVVLVTVLPFALVAAMLVKLDGGPVFYSQERLTKNNKPFKILKFRTMIPDAEKLSGPVLAGEDDTRITKTGKLMRTIRIDEVPQLINIFKGEMSFVGPRPERPFFVEQFEQEIPEYRYRSVVKAGLTGLAQVEGKYNTSVENKLRYDLIYINNYSLWQDLLIILRTIKILFTKSSAEGVGIMNNLDT